MKKSKVIAIAAIGSKSRALGKGNDLIWKIPADLKRFKSETSGHPIIMGSKTYESLSKRPLHSRTNIVLTHTNVRGGSSHIGADEPIYVNSPEEALDLARGAEGSEKIYIIGGGQIYKLLLPYTDTLDLTIIEEDEPVNADTFFPQYEQEFTKIISEEHHEHEGLRYSFVTLSR